MCCLLFGFTLKAQQGNIWYFGNFAGVSFNSIPPSAIGDGQLNSLEGTSVICDANGNLLFYTNGRTVFNKDHDLMLNGANLKGHPSSYQSSIIVPKPGSTNIYYIFTADAWENNGNDGYCYSEVDMTVDAAPLQTTKIFFLQALHLKGSQQLGRRTITATGSLQINGAAISSGLIKLIAME
jgi:hypothetical protein